ncbi:MAG: DUF6883 domain-containing protein [Geminicoccaceae bacterium]
MPALRNADRAVIDPRKLTDYVLDPNSPQGRHKARVFKRALGYDRSNHLGLLASIRKGILTQEAWMIGTTAHGELWQVDLPIIGPGGAASVRTGWTPEEGSDVPRLTTAYVRAA